jgi:bacterioferritin
MRHAEALTDRILQLDGLPNYQRLGSIRIGQTVAEMLTSDLQVEVEAVRVLREGSEDMRKVGDTTSARLFESILEDEERHLDYLETQLQLIEKLGEALYLATHVDPPTE